MSFVNKVLQAVGLKRDKSVKYRGCSIEKFEGFHVHNDARTLGTKRPKSRKFSGYDITMPDDSRPSKVVNTMKAAREYIDNYLGPV